MESSLIVMMQLIGVIAIGSFAGELRRATTMSPEPISSLAFFSAVLAGSFLAFLIAYAIYSYREDKVLALIVGGFVGFQNEKVAIDYLTTFVNRVIGKKEGD